MHHFYHFVVMRYKKKVIRKVLGYQMEIRSGKSKNDWQYSDQKIKGKQWSTKHSVGIAIINRTITYCNWYYYEQYLFQLKPKSYIEFWVVVKACFPPYTGAWFHGTIHSKCLQRYSRLHPSSYCLNLRFAQI
jgi:hypothetical protein